MTDNFIRKPIKGPFPLTPLVLDRDENIDFPALTANVQYLEDIGYPGFIQFGTMGQLFTPSEDEFNRVCDNVVEAADDIAVVIGATAPSQREAIRRARYAEEAGADGSLLGPPYAVQPTASEVVSFYQSVANAVKGEMALMAYNNPALTRFTITPKLWNDHLHSIEAIKAVKDSVFESPHFWESSIINSGKIHFFSGNDNNFYFSSILGATGFTGVFTWVAPHLMQYYYEMCMNKNHLDSTLLDIYKQMVLSKGKLSRIPGAQGPPLLHELVELGGRPAGPLREPYERLDDAASGEIREAVAPLIEMESNHIVK